MRESTEYRSTEGDAGRAPGELPPAEHSQKRAVAQLGEHVAGAAGEAEEPEAPRRLLDRHPAADELHVARVDGRREELHLVRVRVRAQVLDFPVDFLSNSLTPPGSG